MVDKVVSPIDELKKVLLELDLSYDLRDQCDDLITEIEKSQKKSVFALRRLNKDKSITEGFLNETIRDLETATAQLRDLQRQELAKKDRTILYKESQLQQVLDAAPNLISYVDREYRYQITNDLYAQFFGYDRNALKSAHIREVLSEDTFRRLKPLIERAFAGQDQEYELPLADKNEQIYVFKISISPAKNLDGKIIGAYLFGQDITDLKEKEEAINQQNEELEKYIQTNLQLENFAYLASHDLQSPLSNVISFTEALTESSQEKLDETERKFLHYIGTSSKRMQLFINDLLAFALAKNKIINIYPLDPAEVIAEVLDDIKMEQEKHGAMINVRQLPKEVKADRTILKQIFQNLLSNALKFRQPGLKTKIEIKCQEDRNYFVFSVADNGIGIPEEFHDNIFGIFKKLHLYAEYPGTGIGLSTVKFGVKKHCGRVWLDSTEGKGSVFYFSLPK